MKEIHILFNLNHPNIIRVFGTATIEEECFIVMEYIPLGSLKTLLIEADTPFSIETLRDFIISVCKGMVYLSSKKVLHLDLACRNLLVNQVMGKYEIKVTDFGMSRISDYSYGMNGKAIPIRTSAPEVLTGGQATSRSDVWSFGVVMWEILSGGLMPYMEISDNQEVTQKVLSGLRLSKPSNCSDQVYEIMLKCWDKKTPNRPPFAELLDLLIQAFPKSEEKVISETKKEQNGEGYQITND